MPNFLPHKLTNIDANLYQAILTATKQIFKQNFGKATPMYFDPAKKQQLVGWHLLLSDEKKDDSEYFVLYETDLFDSVAQIRLLRGDLQIQYTLEANNVILLSQFRVDVELNEWDDNSDNGVITIGQPITNFEAKGLFYYLNTIIGELSQKN